VSCFPKKFPIYIKVLENTTWLLNTYSSETLNSKWRTVQTCEDILLQKSVWLQSCDLTPDRTIQQHIPNSTFTVTAIRMPHPTYTILIVCKITDFLNTAYCLIFKHFILYFIRFRNTRFSSLPIDHTKSWLTLQADNMEHNTYELKKNNNYYVSY